jgi:enamine deaminase RidA (YjgF/YER057c/UK114 family)
MTGFSNRLAALGLILPSAPRPIATYMPTKRVGNLIWTSGQVCLGPDGTLADRHRGKLGSAVSQEAGVEAARFAALNVLAQLQASLGSLDEIAVSCVRLGGFINAEPSFTAVAQVMNGASDLMVDMFQDLGRHARSTVGVASLPLDAAVEVEAVFEILF